MSITTTSRHYIRVLPTGEIQAWSKQPRDSPLYQRMAHTSVCVLLELAVEASDLLIDPAKIRQAYALLGAPRHLDEAPIAARRTTCREIAAAIEAAFTPGSGLDAPITSLDAVLPWWVAAAAWTGEDPRSVAIRTTGAREHAELVAAITGRDGEALDARRRLARDRQS